MDARPARITGKPESLLTTAVFATTDAAPELIPGGGDDYQPLPPENAEPRPQVRWRPRGPVAACRSAAVISPAGNPEAADTVPAPARADGGLLDSIARDSSPDATRRWRGENTGRSSDRARRLTQTAATVGGEPAQVRTPAALPPGDSAAAAPWLAVSRGVAAFLGTFTLLNVLGEMRHPGFDANLWWIDLRPLPPALARAALALAATLLLAFGLFPAIWARWRTVTLAILGVLLAASVWNTARYYHLLRVGDLHSGPAIPFSLHVSICLVVILAGVRAVHGRSEPPRRGALIGGTAFFACLLAFPLAQMQCFGCSDYRRPADVIVVFGCRVHADGTPSDALVDRVATGCRLYHDGLAKRLILSGGPGPGVTHETEAMRKLALEQGVPAEAIELDAGGLNTAATVTNTAQLCRERSLARILAVSHAYHLPRIKLCYRRAGADVFTVPAVQQRPLQHQTWSCARELAALWWYYARPLAQLDGRH